MGAGSAPAAPIEPVRISACDGSARRGPTAPAAAPRPPAGTHRWVPDDLAVVGFDGSEEGAYTVPTLTTVAPDKAAIAERAVERIADRIAGISLDRALETVTPFRLEVRE